MLDTFYSRLPPLADFADLADPASYAPVPDGWHVVLTDVRGSTAAVQAGRYREVNYVGAASIAAALNAIGRADVPFVFGGDGATLVLPEPLLAPVLGALAALQAHAAARLDLALRVGSVPVAEIRAHGHALGLARLQVSPGYAQALLSGTGVAHAEHLVKSDDTGPRYASHAAPTEGADPYEGLECRWQDIRSPHGETVSLLVEAVAEPRAAVYRTVLDAVARIYGSGDAPHPIALDHLRLHHAPARFDPEVRLRHADHSRRARARLWAQSLIGRFLMARRMKTEVTDWGAYPTLLREATDYRKFDGVLRMVLAGSTAQRLELEALLDDLYEQGTLAYGVHVSDRATLTCLVYERMGHQVHFVDGAEGGYTAAAVPFKQRLRTLSA
jgi:hypothetical protein